MTDQIMIPAALLKRIISHLLYAYAAQQAKIRYKHITNPSLLRPERLEVLLRDLDDVLKK
jgi:hypothetical protein